MSITGQGLHILPGESAAGTWNLVFGAEDRLLVHRDDLTCGPLCAFETIAMWTSMRLAFWNTISPEKAGEVPRNSTDDSPGSDLLSSTARLRDASEIFIWAGNDLRDQFFFFFTCKLLHHTGTDPAAIHVVPLKVMPHQNGRYISVGSSGREDLKRHPEPVRLTAEALETCHTVWEAVTSESPTDLLDFIRTDSSYASHILTNLVNRYPQRTSGLSLWDHMLLERVGKNGPNAAWVIAEVLCDTWEIGDSVGESYLYYRLKQLSNPQNTKPLLELTENMENCRGAEATLTQFGRAVLEGRTSNYPTNPIDEWIGGVHLSSEHRIVWMHDGGTLRNLSASV